MSPSPDPSAGRLESKAVRVSQACTRCQSKKVRCDGQTPACGACVGKGHECIYTQVQRRRGPGRSKQYIQALEQRLSNMESALGVAHDSEANVAAAAAAAASAPATSLGDATASASAPTSTASSAERSSKSPASAAGAQDPASSGLPSSGPDSAATDTPQTRYVDPFAGPHTPDRVFEMATSAEPDFNARNIEKIPSKLRSFALIFRRMRLMHNTTSHPFKRQVFTQNFTQDEALNMAMPLEEAINSNYALVNLKYFIPRFKTWPNAQEIFESPSGFSYLSVVIAIGSMNKTLNTSFGPLSRFSWPFFKNAYAALPTLIAQGDDLLSVQAVVTMAVFAQANSCSRMTATLAGTAARLANTTGLHRSPTVEPGKETPDDDPFVRNRVFWSAYILDKTTSLLHGVPSVQDDDDIETELPPFSEPDGMPNWFRLRGKLAIVESSISSRLYTAKALRLPDSELLKNVLGLDLMLEDWRSDLIPGMQILYDGPPPDVELCPGALHVYLAFYFSSCMVHWAVRRHSQWVGGSGVAMDNLQLSFSRMRYRIVAEAVIHVMMTISRPQYADLWRMICYPLCAAFMLFAEILENPAAPESEAAVETTGSLLAFFRVYAKEEECDLERVISALATLQGTVEHVIKEAHGDAGSEAWNLVDAIEPGALKWILASCTHPMYLVQGLIGNLPNRDQRLVIKLAQLLGKPVEKNKDHGPLASPWTWPEAYGFKFEAGVA